MGIFAISGLINALVVTSLGIFVAFYGLHRRVIQLYCLLVGAVVIWSVGYWRWLLSDNYDTALFWVRVLSIGSSLIPIFFFHWIVTFLDQNIKQKNTIRLVYILGFLFLLFSFSDLFVKGLREKMFFTFWPDPGIIYHFYLFFTYILLAGYSLILLFKNYKVSTGEKKAQIIYIIIGGIIGFGGGITNFFLWYDIPIPPFGNFLVALYPFLLGYAIVKHHLFDIRIITTELFTFVIWIVLLIKVILSKTYQDFIINISLLVAVIIAGILLIRSVVREVRQREQIEAMAKEVQKAYEVEKKARTELQKLDEAKNQFIMATQHHLRTPLTSMRGYLDLLLDGSYGRIGNKVKDVLKKFQVSTLRLIKVINEFLDISQFQLGREVVFLQPNINIKPIFDEIMEELSFEAKSKGIYLKIKKPGKNFPKIKADPEKLKIALFNVIDNGIKYTNKGGLTVKTITADSKIRIEVSDTGIGMGHDEITTLFSKLFERGEQAKRIFATGRGIGLFIASQIIRSHHGKIWAESKGKGLGSTFYVELPIS